MDEPVRGHIVSLQLRTSIVKSQLPEPAMNTIKKVRTLLTA